MKKENNLFEQKIILHLLMAFAICLLISVHGQAAVYYVKTTGNDGNSGTSWAQAFQTLQKAIDVASAGDEIWVAAGTYKPTTTADRSISYEMKEGVEIYGGFNGSETNLNQRNWETNTCTLSGDIGTIGDNSDNSYHVFYHSDNGLTAAARLDGFIVTLGNANGGGLANSGGGFLNFGVAPTIANCSFTENHSVNSGGAIFNSSSNLNFINCEFANNSSVQAGGAIYNRRSSFVSFSGCKFISNIATACGGGIGGNDTNIELSNCIFKGNSSFCGGAIITIDGEINISNGLFIGNTSSYDGGALAIHSSNNTTIKNCSFSGNESTQGGAIFFKDISTAKIFNSILWGNNSTNSGNLSSIYNINTTPIVTYSIIHGGHAGTGNLNQNPRFIEQPPIGLGTVGDLHLMSCSPAIDAGTNSSAPPNDIEDEPRPHDGDGNLVATTDMGAYEYQGGPPPITGTPFAPIQLGAHGNSKRVEHSFDNLCTGNNYNGSPGYDAFYKIERTMAGSWRIATENATFNSVLYLFDNNANLMATNNGPGNDAEIKMNDVPSGIYFIIVDGHTASSWGTFDLKVGLGSTIAANFTASAPLCSFPKTYFFTDQSTLPDAWSWEFGDGGTSTAQNPIHTYSAFGTYQVKLTIIDTFSTISFSKMINIYVVQPIADFSGNPLNGCPPLTVNFNDESIAAEEWSWDFGDGSTSILQSPTHAYQQLGIYTVTLTITDINGCASTITKSDFISVTDNETPLSVCPTSISDVVLDGNGNGTLPANIGDGSSTDNCGSPTETSPSASFTCADLGVQTVVLTADDGNGNTDTETCSFNVVDNTDPDITCPANVTKECDQSTSSIWTGVATATDNCTASPTISESDASTQGTSGCSYYSYTIIRTWAADDGNGNTASCDQTITVVDTGGPLMYCPANVTVECDGDHSPAGTGSATAVDNCDTQPAITSSDAAAPGNCANEWTITRTWTGTDACGNASSCDQIITVEDSTGPDITCPANVTVECDEDSSPANTGTATAIDNCDAAPAISESDSTAPGSCANEWTITRTWTATDECGKSSSCDQTINVEDSTAPDITCPANVTVECDDDHTSAANGTATATDNCSAAGDITIGESDATTGGACPQEWTITRTWTATDECGQSTSCDQTITVEDSTGPTMSCGPLTVTPNADGIYALSQAEIDGLGAGSVDNCGTVAFSASPNTFDCADEGANTITVTGTDECGNTSTCNATVTVNEFIQNVNIAPTPESCTGAGDGGITISATAGGGQIKYSIDNGANFSASGAFTNLSPGAYNIVIKVFGIPNVCKVTGMATVDAGGTLQLWYKDIDGDGYSDGVQLTSCTQPAGYIQNPLPGVDCNDYDANAFPGQTWYKDADNDNYTDGTTQVSCLRPAGYKSAAELVNTTDIDCNDNNAAVNHGATEVCNGIDDDCDGQIDEGTLGGLTYIGNIYFSTQAQVDAWSACYSVIQGSVTIVGAGINNLGSLGNITQITGNLTIQSTGLTSMAGLNALANVGGTLTIYFNSSLSTLNGLGNLATVGGSFMMYYNFQLSDCCAVYGLINGGVTGSAVIFFNKVGCNSVAEINSNCAPPPPLVAGPSTSQANGQTINLKEVTLFPNPAKGIFSVAIPDGFTKGDIAVIDMYGCTVLGQTLEEGQRVYQLEAGLLPSGMYMVVVQTPDQPAQAVRLIVE